MPNSSADSKPNSATNSAPNFASDFTSEFESDSIQSSDSDRLSSRSRSTLSPKRARIVRSLRYLFGKSGGISYHITAMRFRRRWAPFLRHVEGWLNAWPTPQNELIIFGASAGWTLPAHFLARFERVIVIEPDPAARFLLRWRFPKVQKWVFHDEISLLPWLVSSQSNQLKKFLDQYPNAAVLFSNLLGQIPLVWPRELSPAEWSRCNSIFIDALKQRNWASYHDLLSAISRPTEPFEKIVWRAGESLVELGARVWSVREKQIVVADHGMDWLKSTEVAIWHLRPKTYHLIGFVNSMIEITSHN